MYLYYYHLYRTLGRLSVSAWMTVPACYILELRQHRSPTMASPGDSSGVRIGAIVLYEMQSYVHDTSTAVLELLTRLTAYLCTQVVTVSERGRSSSKAQDLGKFLSPCHPVALCWLVSSTSDMNDTSSPKGGIAEDSGSLGDVAGGSGSASTTPRRSLDPRGETETKRKKCSFPNLRTPSRTREILHSAIWISDL